jgi:hypothetical protein
MAIAKCLRCDAPYWKVSKVNRLCVPCNAMIFGVHTEAKLIEEKPKDRKFRRLMRGE